ncbi:MAG: hypothetical protein U1C54_04795 [Xanthomonadaceae bacterium]|nr:hypothetical protein [Xanthomonadaceae bacterium]MDZ4379125.1 hypothetical protein [Xanthomonadaceae bacterium]
MATAPIGALVVVIAGWALGSVVGGWLAAKLAPRSPVAHALVLGGVLTLAGIANNMMIPPPMWFWLGSLAVLIPGCYFGARLGAGSRS